MTLSQPCLSVMLTLMQILSLILNLKGLIVILNRSILIGRLTKDGELRYTPAGVAVFSFTLAVDRPFSNSQTKEREADFIPIVVWRQLAETCAQYLRKGRLTAIEGRIQVRNYDNNEGKRIYITEVIADNVRFLESSGGNSGQQQNQLREQQDPFIDDGKPIDISDEDLPFS